MIYLETWYLFLMLKLLESLNRGRAKRANELFKKRQKSTSNITAKHSVAQNVSEHIGKLKIRKFQVNGLEGVR